MSSELATVTFTARLPFRVAYVLWRDHRGRHLWLNEGWQTPCLHAALVKGGMDLDRVLERATA